MTASYVTLGEPTVQESGRRSANVVTHLFAALIGFGLGCALIHASGGQPMAAILPSDNMAVQFMQPAVGFSPINLGINGFGRIGRQVARIAMDREDFVLKHINS